MNNPKVTQWLRERQVTLEDSFFDVFRDLVYEYQSANSGITIAQIYHRLGISRQSLYWWETHSQSVQSKNGYRHKLILSAAELFGLNAAQAELLAHKAGISLKVSEDFHLELRKAVYSFKRGLKSLCRSALISQRMMEYFMGGGKNHVPSKLSITAIAIALGLEGGQLQRFHR